MSINNKDKYKIVLGACYNIGSVERTIKLSLRWEEIEYWRVL